MKSKFQLFKPQVSHICYVTPINEHPLSVLQTHEVFCYHRVPTRVVLFLGKPFPGVNSLATRARTLSSVFTWMWLPERCLLWLLSGKVFPLCLLHTLSLPGAWWGLLRSDFLTHHLCTQPQTTPPANPEDSCFGRGFLYLALCPKSNSKLQGRLF